MIPGKASGCFATVCRWRGNMAKQYPLLASLNNLAAVLIRQVYSLRDGVGATMPGRAYRCVPLAREVLQLAPMLRDHTLTYLRSVIWAKCWCT